MRILATDFDGTLFRDGTVTEKDRDAIMRFRRVGNRFGIVTGRHLPSILEEIDRWQVPFDFIICCTGGVLLDRHCRVFSEHLAPRAAVQPLYAETLRFDGMYFCISKGLERIWFDTGHPPVYENIKVLPPEKLPILDGFHEMGTRFADEETARRYVETLNTKYPDLMTAHQNGVYIDVCAPHTSKVRGLYEILEHFGVPQDALFVAGDNLNDLEMLREFHSFAVASGREEVKAAAEHTVSDIAEIIEKLL